jgi:hypothetical protein
MSFAIYSSLAISLEETASGFQTQGWFANSRGVQRTYFLKTVAK